VRQGQATSLRREGSTRRWALSAAGGVIGVLLLAIALPGLLAKPSRTPAGPYLVHGSRLPVPPGATPLTSASAPATPLALPPTPAPPAVRFLDAPLSVRPGQRVTLRARAEPDAECSIQVGYTGAPSLDTATADSDGSLSWTWRVSRQAPTGTWPITVSCGARTASTNITVS
jgi:hypothetical protein